jgi:hypothetical protein
LGRRYRVYNTTVKEVDVKQIKRAITQLPAEELA